MSHPIRVVTAAIRSVLLETRPVRRIGTRLVGGVWPAYHAGVLA